MRDAVLRKQKDEWLTPLVNSSLGSVHPNVLSIIAMLIGLCAVVAISNQLYLAGLGLWWLNRILDGLDGLVARIHKKQSDFGGYLDLVLDFVVYLMLPLAFVWANPSQSILWGFAILMISYVINTVSWTTLAALLEKRRISTQGRLTSMEMPVGLIEGAETIIFYSLFCILPAQIAQLFILMALLVFFTAVQRIVWAWKNLT